LVKIDGVFIWPINDELMLIFVAPISKIAFITLADFELGGCLLDIVRLGIGSILSIR